MSDPGAKRAPVGLVVVTHGRLAEQLVEAMKRIVGEPALKVEAVSIDWDGDMDAAAKRVAQAVARGEQGAGVLVVTDMFGGTPSNLALALHDPGRVEIVTGVNLAMLLKFVTLDLDRTDLGQASRTVAAEGRESIQVATDVLRPGPGPAGGQAPK